MDKQHPHFGATYKISRQLDGSFAVEVVFPAAPRVNVKGFASEALAEIWVANHEREIATGSMARPKLHLRKKSN